MSTASSEEEGQFCIASGHPGGFQQLSQINNDILKFSMVIGAPDTYTNPCHCIATDLDIALSHGLNNDITMTSDDRDDHL